MKELYAIGAAEASEAAADANRPSDSFILVTVIVASVMFFAGVGTKLKGKTTRVTMLIVAGFLAVHEGPDSSDRAQTLRSSPTRQSCGIRVVWCGI